MRQSGGPTYGVGSITWTRNSGSPPTPSRVRTAMFTVMQWNCSSPFGSPNIGVVDKNPIRLSATATLLHGDVMEMTRQHLADASIDLVIADVPYFLRGPEEPPNI